MQYSTRKHCVYDHRYHLVWSAKYRFKVLHGQLRLRDICRRVCAQNDVKNIKDVTSSDQVHMFVSVQPKLAISDMMRLMKGRSSHSIQREFPQIKKCYQGRHFWGRGTFQPQTGPSPKTSYFSIWNSILPVLPTTVGSGFIWIEGRCLLPLV